MNQDVIFGIHAVLSAIEQSPERVQDVIISKDRQDKRMQKIVDAARAIGVRTKFVERSAFE